MGVRVISTSITCIAQVYPSANSLRHYIGIFREESLLSALKSRLETVRAHDFDVLSLESHQKDGGVFVRFSYSASDPEGALNTIESKVREEAAKRGGLPSWLGLGGGNVWVVKGTPWREVCTNCTRCNIVNDSHPKR
jgi:hypothetical protein